MIALKIAEVKDFMNKLLCQDVFDHFLIQEAVITTNVSCHIDGTLQKDFYTLEELEEQNLTGLSFVPYGLLRSSCFNLIKGKKTPSYFKFSLLLSPGNLYHQNVCSRERGNRSTRTCHCVCHDLLFLRKSVKTGVRKL